MYVFDLLCSFVCISFVYSPGYLDFEVMITFWWEVKWQMVGVLEFARDFPVMLYVVL